MPSVLVIDDDEDSRAYLATLLSRSGYEVHELADGRDIGVFIAIVAVDAIITDLFMPGADGLETIRAVERLAPSIPVIGITGADPGYADIYIRAMKSFGAAAVLLKPVDGNALLSVLSEVITRRTAARRDNAQGKDRDGR